MTPRGLSIVVLLAVSLLTACAPDPEYYRAYPDEPGLSLDFPVAGSHKDYDPEGFDYCTPFTDRLFAKVVLDLDTPRPGPDSCTIEGPHFTATIALETGRSLAEISNDPRWRPGGTGSSGNRYWETAVSDAVNTSDIFLALGPARPDQLIHVSVEDDGENIPLREDGIGRAWNLSKLLVDDTSAILEFGTSG